MAIDKTNLVKSVSGYVLREKHQNVNNGEIFERDITTIGGRNNTSKTGIPVYSSSNFIITEANDVVKPKATKRIEWEKNPESGEEIWTLDTIQEETITQEEDSASSLELKLDVYDLRNFAYFGSCTELIRASLNHIVDIFPGELYATTNSLTYYDRESDSYFSLGTGTTQYLVDNPFAVNLHDLYVDEIIVSETPLKYFNARKGYLNYDFISQDEDSGEDIFYDIIRTTYLPSDSECVPPYGFMGTLQIEYGKNAELEKDITVNGGIKIDIWRGEGQDVVYLSDTTGWHIRPKNKFYKQFRQELYLFEKALLAEDTAPKYSPQFEIYQETEYGYEIKLQTFSFPIAEGGYNLGINTLSYQSYITKLTTVSAFYDDFFSDNLYRSMTHEAIKNFDWSFTRKYTDGETYQEGGSKVQKLIRIIAREFDEIRLYIQGITHVNNISYDGKDNTPDYLLTDMLELNGWIYTNTIPFNDMLLESLNNIQPYVLSDEDKSKDYCDCNQTAIEKVKTYSDTLEYSPNTVNNLFVKLLGLNSRYLWRKKGTIEGIESLLSVFGLKNKSWVDKLTSERQLFTDTLKGESVCPAWDSYSNVDIDDWDYEIEEYVSVVNPIDLNIPLNDETDITIGDFFNDINLHKRLQYEEDLDLTNIPTPWRGLLARELYFETEDEDNPQRLLFPYFDKNADNDGLPYYQMNGGWLRKSKSMDAFNNIITKPYFTETISKIHSVNDIRELLNVSRALLHDGDICYVHDISKRFLIVDGYAYELTDYADLSETYLDGINSYSLEEYRGVYYYFETTVRNGSIVVGDKLYSGTIHTLEPNISLQRDDNGDVVMTPLEDGTAVPQWEFKVSRTVYPIGEYPDNSTIKLYVTIPQDENGQHFVLESLDGTKCQYYAYIDGEKCFSSDDFQPIPNLCSPANSCNTDLSGKIQGSIPTQYFMLSSVNYNNRITFVDTNKSEQALGFGWNQLTAESDMYNHALSVQDYYLGNNPHTTTIPFDLGKEYMNYFIHLFKYAYENDLFEWNDMFIKYGCYTSESQLQLREDIYNFGFSEINKDCDDYIITPDKKIHCFMQVLSGFDDESKAEENKNLSLKEQTYPTYVLLDKTNDKFITIYPDSFINTKRVKLKFKCKPEAEKAKFKYIDKVVIPYLEQILPSNLIIEIDYV